MSFFDDIEDDIMNDDISDNMDKLYNTDLSTCSTYNNVPIIPFADIINKDIFITNKRIALYSAANKKLNIIHFRNMNKLRNVLSKNNEIIVVMSPAKSTNLYRRINENNPDPIKFYVQKYEEQWYGANGRLYKKEMEAHTLSDTDLTNIDVIIDLDRYKLHQ